MFGDRGCKSPSNYSAGLFFLLGGVKFNSLLMHVNSPPGLPSAVGICEPIKFS